MCLSQLITGKGLKSLISSHGQLVPITVLEVFVKATIKVNIHINYLYVR